MWLTAFVALLLLIPLALVAGAWEGRRYDRRQRAIDAAKYRHPSSVHARRREGRE